MMKLCCRIIIKALTVIAALSFWLGNFTGVALAVTPDDFTVLQPVNDLRRQNGLAPLVMDSKIYEAAAIRAEETSRLLSHDRPDGSDCLTVFKDIGMACHTSGENITAGMDMGPERAFANWADSPTHLDNILYAPFTHTGIAHFALPNGQTYWLQLFAAPVSGLGEELAAPGGDANSDGQAAKYSYEDETA